MTKSEIDTLNDWIKDEEEGGINPWDWDISEEQVKSFVYQMTHDKDGNLRSPKDVKNIWDSLDHEARRDFMEETGQAKGPDLDRLNAIIDPKKDANGNPIALVDDKFDQYGYNQDTGKSDVDIWVPKGSPKRLREAIIGAKGLEPTIQTGVDSFGSAKFTPAPNVTLDIEKIRGMESGKGDMIDQIERVTNSMAQMQEFQKARSIEADVSQKKVADKLAEYLGKVWNLVYNVNTQLRATSINAKQQKIDLTGSAGGEGEKKNVADTMVKAADSDFKELGTAEVDFFSRVLLEGTNSYVALIGDIYKYVDEEGKKVTGGKDGDGKDGDGKDGDGKDGNGGDTNGGDTTGGDTTYDPNAGTQDYSNLYKDIVGGTDTNGDGVPDTPAGTTTTTGSDAATAAIDQAIKGITDSAGQQQQVQPASYNPQSGMGMNPMGMGMNPYGMGMNPYGMGMNGMGMDGDPADKKKKKKKDEDSPEDKGYDDPSKYPSEPAGAPAPGDAQTVATTQQKDGAPPPVGQPGANADVTLKDGTKVKVNSVVAQALTKEMHNTTGSNAVMAYQGTVGADGPGHLWTPADGNNLKTGDVIQWANRTAVIVHNDQGHFYLNNGDLVAFQPDNPSGGNPEFGTFRGFQHPSGVDQNPVDANAPGAAPAPPAVAKPPVTPGAPPPVGAPTGKG
ncbi:MAG: hypothetical protein HOQ24_02770 [Mycobacteriaceae bacterium]|nr:hypothetical protein [Mycobacteriaceae bacterium]